MDCKQITKKQHFVPEFYFSNFLSDGKLWVYNLRYKSYSQKSPAQICYQPYIYETTIIDDNRKEKLVFINEIENHYCERETRYAEIWKKIGASFSDITTQEPELSSEENELLAECVVNLLVRNPDMINLLDKDAVNELLVNLGKLKEIKGALGQELCINERYAMFAAYKYEWLDERIKSSYPQIIKNELLEMQRVFYVTYGRNYITSNIPVALKSHMDGFIAMIMVPLSPHCLVTYNSIRFTKTLVELPTFAVDVVNSVFTSRRFSDVKFIYGKNRADIEIYYRER